jgi:serine phosphatase RsbU (regulator of sigma subunit)
VTLFYGVLDAACRTLAYTNAGHLRPIQINGSRSVQQLENGGALLGVFPEWKYENSVAQLAPGDQLLLFTDGIIEATKPDGEEFGEQRLIDVATRRSLQSSAELRDQLLTELRGFCDSQLQDDATLLVVSVTNSKHQDVGSC